MTETPRVSLKTTQHSADVMLAMQAMEQCHTVMVSFLPTKLPWYARKNCIMNLVSFFSKLLGLLYWKELFRKLIWWLEGISSEEKFFDSISLWKHSQPCTVFYTCKRDDVTRPSYKMVVHSSWNWCQRGLKDLLYHAIVLSFAQKTFCFRWSLVMDSL